MINELVQRLSKGDHKISMNERGEALAEIKERIANGFIHVKFTETKGGTELGINVDKSNTNIDKVDFDNGEGELHLEGTTTLNYNKVRCIVDVKLKTMTGKGYLKIEDEKLNLQ
jgi:hypothetical protein